MSQKDKLKEVALVFFKLGCFAFGGPAAHVAMMEEEVVNKRKWMDRQYFLDLMGATNLIPGPNSTEMTMHCGHERAGKLGLFVAGICFIFPAVVITGFLAWLYLTYGALPEVEGFVYGIKPAVLAIIAGAIFKLGKKALKSTELGIIGALVVVACFLDVHEIIALLTAGITGMLYFKAKNGIKLDKNDKKAWLPFLLVGSSAPASVAVTSATVFWTFLKVGAILYGSGYVLFAYLQAELVDTGYMTLNELIDAIAVGQFTPGPVLSTATFIGFQLSGFWGALGATAGIFLPSFLFVLILNPLIPRMRKSTVLRYFLDAVNIAAVAVMLVVLFEMARETILNYADGQWIFEWRSALIAALAFGLVFGLKKSNPIILVLGGGILGYLLLLI
ncbi:MAG: chromate efflux transporter [Crocinitomix sp.]|nr:chromate efflux transporter [Crocinitomix sp.]